MYYCPKCTRYGLEWDARAKILLCLYANCSHVIRMSKDSYDGIPTDGQIKHAIKNDREKNEMEDCQETPEPIAPEVTDWMGEAKVMAAQCWCDPRVSDREMDPVLAKVFAEKIAAWMDTAAQNQGNTDYYRGLVVQCGKYLGHDAYVQDDGGVVPDVLCAKVPKLVRQLTLHAVRLEAMREGCVAIQQMMNSTASPEEAKKIQLQLHKVFPIEGIEDWAALDSNNVKKGVQS